MNEYIKSLKNAGKLNISIDKTKQFNWKYTKIAGPCSVEGPEIIDIAKKIKSSQKKAFPSSEFKQQLADKLSNIYILNIESEEKSRFTFLQMF